MAEIPSHIIKTLKDFIKELEKENVYIEQAILFGSYAMGNYDEWSDIDIALVPKDFEGNRPKDICKLIDAKFNVSTDIAPLPFRPEDFTPENLFIKEILRYGVKIV